MAEREREEFSFIKEQIKDKPIDKRQVLKKGAGAIFLGLLFGAAACVAFVLLHPLFSEMLGKKPDEFSVEIETEEATELEILESTEHVEEVETESEEIENQELPAVKPETETLVQIKELELTDYQMLQNKLYMIGKNANRFIVTVTGVSSDTDWYNNAYESSGQAAGVILGDNKRELLILTEYKAIQEAEEISVTFIDNVTVTANLKKYDGNTGLAILSIDMEQIEVSTKNAISYVVLGNSKKVSLGNVVIAAGSPLGTIYSLGTGNITSVGNTIHTTDHNYSVFTTDIVGNDNSSGVLLNLKGEAVGLVMQDFGTETDGSTLTAISISELKSTIEMLANGRDIPYLGLKVVTVTDKIAEKNEIPQGVFIKEVGLDSPALSAGLQNGDIITALDGVEIFTEDEFSEKVLTLQPGNTIEVTVKRQGMDAYNEITCAVTAGILAY